MSKLHAKPFQYMQWLWVVLGCALIAACQHKSLSEQELLDRECKHINWKHLDEWPSIEACAQIKSDTLRKKCLVDFLSQQCVEQLHSLSGHHYGQSGDTLWVLLTVAPRQPIRCEWSDRNKLHVDNNNRALLDSLQKNLPPVMPGTKRGVAVTTLLHIPFIIP